MKDTGASAEANRAATPSGAEPEVSGKAGIPSAEWRSPDTAPKDGRWFIGVFETGGHLFEPRVGRYRPIYCEEIGLSYDWEVIDRPADDFDADVPSDGIFHHYAEIYEWMPLPRLEGGN